MSNNQLEILDESFFNGLSMLKRISLSFNKLIHLDSNIFKDLKYLASVDLKENNFEIHLEILKLSFSSYAFVSLSGNTYFEMKSTKNIIVELGNHKYSSGTEAKNTSSEDINRSLFKTNFSNENLSHGNNFCLNTNLVEEFIFINPDKIENEIDLTLMRIKLVHPDTFHNMENLKSIDLSSNFLTNLDSKIFNGLQNLNSIDLSYNELDKKLDFRLFKGLKKLETVCLNDNFLTDLDYKTFQGLFCLKTIKLHNNYFVKSKIELILEYGVNFVSLKSESENNLELIVHPKLENYKIMEYIGSGGFGDVYRVECLTSREMYIKDINLDLKF